MLDINIIRKNPILAKEGCAKKQVKIDIDKILQLDKKKKQSHTKIQLLLTERNRISKKGKEVSDEEKKESRKLREAIKSEEQNFGKFNNELDKLMFKTPNLPFEDVLVGKNEDDNVVLSKVGEIVKFDFSPKDHIEIGIDLDIINLRKASQVSGSRFYYLKNEAVLLEFALISYVFKTLMPEKFTPIIPPAMIKEAPYRAMGRLAPGEEDEKYYIERDNIYLIGSAEHTIGPLHMNEFLEEKDMPLRYIGFSTCFRREAGSYGKDVKGILRSHQFDKLEMFSFTTPENSKKEHKFLLSMQEKLMKGLELPYQVVEVCTGDMGFVDAKQYDIETWIPTQGKYRETHSCSNTTDYQARGIGCQYRNKDGKSGYVHMLNATGIAIGRILIAIMENYQQKDGSIKIPKVLQGYLETDVIGYKKNNG